MNDTTDIREIRATVRDLVARWKQEHRLTTACDSWLRSYDPAFSREMGRLGLIGVTWPEAVGGAGKAGITRLAVTEELLRVGAPVAGHWIADRQIGPSILRHGSEAAKAKYLPGIASGEMVFCLGMSETESGSDLASVRTAATRVDGGWIVTGRKVWTSQAHHATHAYVLARTEKTAVKHEGLSEFIVDMSDPGVEVRPIYDLAGEHHFNEVTFDAVKVNDDHVLGAIGGGWKQVTSQLSLERGGIERVLSTYPLLAGALEHLRDSGELHRGDATLAGEMLARLGALRAMAVRVALDIDAGGSPVVSAAVLKDLGTAFENDVIEFARTIVDAEADPRSADVEGLLAGGILASPGFTIRGGTSEVLQTLISRGVGELTAEANKRRGELASAVDDIVRDAGGEPEDQDEVRELLAELGWLRVAVDEENGGEGGSVADAAEIIGSLARRSVSTPIAENVVALRVLARAGRNGLDELGRVTVALGATARVTIAGDSIEIDGTLTRVPWGIGAAAVLVRAESTEGAEVLVVVPSDVAGAEWEAGVNLAGEPRDTLVLSHVALPIESLIPADSAVFVEAGLFKAAETVGTLETALIRTIEHVTVREQFDRPLIKFQAVAGLLAQLASEFTLAQVALEEAVKAVNEERSDAETRVAAARVIASRAATLGARIAHQLHAAMGVTREHPLHLSTRRMWSSRDEAGTARSWAQRLGNELVAQSESDVWAWITEENY
jgi:alkylation response protein AidB-like acyl-CoA dehydrogenase